jgi:soluble lytic murein transglycosylase
MSHEMTPRWASAGKVYHAGDGLASIDTPSFLNYKNYMQSKRNFFNLALIAILTACTYGTGPNPVSPTTQVPVLDPTAPLTPASIPTPTPTPEVRVQTGEIALFNGDYDQAQYQYQTALDTSTDPLIRAAALWGLGRVQFILHNNSASLTTLWILSSQFPSSPNAIRAYFLMGEIYMALDRYAEAAEAYTIFLALRPGVIDAAVQERRGDAFNSAGNFPEAISAYQAALIGKHISDDTSLNLKLAQAYFDSGDSNTALAMYDALAASSSNDYLKAQLDLLSGRIHLSLGQIDEGYQHYAHSVEYYPMANDSYQALVALVNDGIQVDEMDRGLVDYFAGEYGYALDAFQRYIIANPENDGTPYYYRAMALRKKGENQQAIDEFSTFILNYPSNRYWQSAWAEKADTQWFNLGEYTAAIQTLFAFIQLAPNDPNASVYLMEAARIQERAGLLDDASATWDRVANEYPGSELVTQALFFAGIVRYRQNNYNEALVYFQRDAILSTDIGDQVRAYYWIGKTQNILGDTSAAQETWQQTASLDTTDYYSLRAQDMLFGRSNFSPISSNTLVIDLPAEKLDAESWLRVTFNLSTDTDLSGPGGLTTDERFVRGTEFWQLGLNDEAQIEFDDLLASSENNPADCFRLANYFLELGLYTPAIYAVRQVLTLAGMITQAQTLAAPPYFNHIRYGLYYQDLVFPAAQQTGFDPYFIFSLIRQESLFEKLAGSDQGALGLMQITPQRGQIIADGLGWPPNFSTQDLYRPMVSIGLGTFHLRDLRLSLNGDLSAALAGYNAGPDAAPIWLGLSGSDPDLFVEVIRYEETRTYIRSIYEIYEMYRSLYTNAP